MAQDLVVGGDTYTGVERVAATNTDGEVIVYPEGGDTASNAVQYVPQKLDEAEQTQARRNINAMGCDDIFFRHNAYTYNGDTEHITTVTINVKKIVDGKEVVESVEINNTTLYEHAKLHGYEGEIAEFYDTLARNMQTLKGDGLELDPKENILYITSGGKRIGTGVGFPATSGGEVWLVDGSGTVLGGEVCLVSRLYKYHSRVAATDEEVNVGDRVICTEDGAVLAVQSKHALVGNPAVGLSFIQYFMDGYTNSEAGKDGEDGVSPTVEITEIEGGHRVTITDAEGEKPFDVLHGKDGKDGQDAKDGADGISPTVETTQIDGGYRVSITDKNGTKQFVVPCGKDGKDGDDGYSPIIGVAEIYGGTGYRVTLIDKNGEKQFDVLHGRDGKDGQDAKDGKDGQDGVSPTITRENITGGNRLTITDKNGSRQIDVMNGTDGKDGTDGVSPTVEVLENGEHGYIVTITDASGPKQFIVWHGEDGADGKSPELSLSSLPSGVSGNRVIIRDAYGEKYFDVTNGKNGVSPTINVTDIYGGHRVTITDANGSQSFDVMDGTGGSGGGTNVQSDLAQNDETQPDFVKNRTHWKEGGLTEILSETTLDTSNGITPIPGDLALKADTECTVVWNGTTYICTARSESLEGIPIIVLGNIDAFAGTGDTGEPFAIAYGDALASIFGTPNVVIAFDESESATLSITADTSVYHKLDNRYIDSEWIASSYYTPSETGYWEKTTPVTNAGKPVATFTAAPLKAGDKVAVRLTGGTPVSDEMYEGKVKFSILSSVYNEEIYCFGNESLAFPGELPDTGEPFFVLSFPSTNEYRVFISNYTEKYLLGVGISRIKYNTLPERFLPESAKTGTVYVQGDLTGGSTRKETVAEIDTNLKAGKRVIYVHNGGTRYTVLSCSYDTEDNMSYLTMADDSGGIYFISYANGWKFEQTCGRVYDSITMKSSTSGSRKRFKITVDDSGTLTATEIV